MFAIRRKSDGKFLTKSYWSDSQWSSDPNKARTFTRVCDAKQSRGWVGGSYYPPYSEVRRDVASPTWLYGKSKDSYVPYTDADRPVEIVELVVGVRDKDREAVTQEINSMLVRTLKIMKDNGWLPSNLEVL